MNAGNLPAPASSLQIRLDRANSRACELLERSLWRDIKGRMEGATSANRTPVMICDIDDTIKSTGKRVVRLGSDWFFNHYKGPIPSQFYFIEAVDPSGLGDPIENVHFPIKQTDWNIVTFLRRILKKDTKSYPDMLASADRYFRDNFFNLGDWRTDEVILPSLVLIREFHLLGGKILFTSLRGQDDDTASDGSSHTAGMLKAFGAWENGDELVFKPGKSKVINSAEDDQNLVSKADMVANHLSIATAIRNPEIVVILDNDPRHHNEFFTHPGINDAVQILVKTNTPLGSPKPLNPDIRFLNPKLPSATGVFLYSLLRGIGILR